jgi:cytoplasmic iron level regulating protein YaaA (DUF328/UPF0246 family)
MVIVISPAKKLDMLDESSALKKATQPLFTDKSQELVDKLKGFKTKDFVELMGVSEKIANLNKERYSQWQIPFNKDNSKPALLSFKGDVYQGMNVDTFGSADFDYAQKHLRILSGLYGCLRPKDLMQAYRLEMGVPLENSAGKNLYYYWQETVTSHLNEAMKANKSDFLVNLASNEYFKSVDKKALNKEIITPVFKEYKNANYKVISFLAKKARGMMCAFLIQNRITNITDIKKFDMAGYKIDIKQSCENELVFLRKQA